MSYPFPGKPVAPGTSGRPSAFRTLALYTGLVGIPALGLVAVLNVGRQLHAPPSVGGAWLVGSVSGGAGECGTLSRGAAVAVSQSGVYVTVTLGGGDDPLSVATRLDGDSLTGTVPANAACPLLADARLMATVDRTSTPHRLAARVVPADGRGAALGFTATRLPAEVRGTGAGH